MVTVFIFKLTSDQFDFSENIANYGEFWNVSKYANYKVADISLVSLEGLQFI